MISWMKNKERDVLNSVKMFVSFCFLLLMSIHLASIELMDMILALMGQYSMSSLPYRIPYTENVVSGIIIDGNSLLDMSVLVALVLTCVLFVARTLKKCALVKSLTIWCFDVLFVVAMLIPYLFHEYVGYLNYSRVQYELFELVSFTAYPIVLTFVFARIARSHDVSGLRIMGAYLFLLLIHVLFQQIFWEFHSYAVTFESLLLIVFAYFIASASALICFLLLQAYRASLTLAIGKAVCFFLSLLVGTLLLTFALISLPSDYLNENNHEDYPHYTKKVYGLEEDRDHSGAVANVYFGEADLHACDVTMLVVNRHVPKKERSACQIIVSLPINRVQDPLYYDRIVWSMYKSERSPWNVRKVIIDSSLKHLRYEFTDLYSNNEIFPSVNVSINDVGGVYPNWFYVTGLSYRLRGSFFVTLCNSFSQYTWLHDEKQ
jgi:hypothetical protein